MLNGEMYIRLDAIARSKDHSQESRELARWACDSIDRLIDEGGKLQDVVERLPVTADGVPITPGSKCYFSSGVEAAVLAVWFCGTLSLQSHDERTGLPTNDWTLLRTAKRHACYSAREAAEAAFAERGEGTNA